MTASYSLQPNEVVLLKDEHVMHDGIWPAYADELTLTNHNLVLLKRGTFGKPKGFLILPLDQIKVYQGRAQAIIGEASNGSTTLDVYLLNGQERFIFQAGGKKKLKKWVVAINDAVTHPENLSSQKTNNALPGAELVAGALKDTFDVFKSKFASHVQISVKCSSCGAPVSGARGTSVACEYCGSTQQL
ncbi:hypothetical protein [Acidipropionibacterium virtanenii]|uniref:PH domain-containing protein n=1 Tax=Acidipropionibacterium virtanenii TaxID=2057246 RepID=A0A344UR68_9ACTN|nr:hypothetical protein [Acidipropionibacterium virtanenii]AXE37766.1 hypothetical protein JS278_00573 [Acidipropionibacterium virtanenii]